MSLLGEDYMTQEGEFVINVGPQHPSTHGVLHLKIWLDGETIKHIQPHLGYIHRSIEKMCESLTYRNFIFSTSRMDYLSAHITSYGGVVPASTSELLPHSSMPSASERPYRK